jgi:hypothetical protein
VQLSNCALVDFVAKPSIWIAPLNGAIKMSDQSKGKRSSHRRGRIQFPWSNRDSRGRNGSKNLLIVVMPPPLKEPTKLRPGLQRLVNKAAERGGRALRVLLILVVP